MNRGKKFRIGRRRLLGSGVIAGAATFGFPWLIPRRVLGTDTAPGANEQIVVGIIGMGVRGSQLVMNVPQSGRIAAICDADANKTAAATRRYQADWDIYQDYRALLDRKDLDAIIISACDHHHVHAGILACQAGKDIYVEKPLSIYVREGRALVHAVRKYGRVAQTGTQQRSMEMNRFACELVRDGGIGNVRVIECVNFRGPSPYPAAGLPAEPVPQGLDWDRWQGQAPVHPYNRRLASHWTDNAGGWWGNWRDYSVSQLSGLGCACIRHGAVRHGNGLVRAGRVLACRGRSRSSRAFSLRRRCRSTIAVS